MNKEKKLYKINELASLCGVTVRALRIYETKGLLIPEYIAESGHRFYDSMNILRLCFINSLKQQGFSLAEIKQLFDGGTCNMDIPQLECKLHHCKEEIKRLNKHCSNLESLISMQKKIQETADVYLDKLPAAIVASRTMMLSHYDELLKQVIEVTGPEMLRLGCVTPQPFYCFSIETGEVSADGKFEVEFCDEVLEVGTDSDIIRFKQLPEVPLAICMKVYGRHSQLETSRVRLFAEIVKRGYNVVGTPRYNYVNGIWNQENPEKWLTIIQIPIEKVNVGAGTADQTAGSGTGFVQCQTGNPVQRQH